MRRAVAGERGLSFLDEFDRRDGNFIEKKKPRLGSTTTDETSNDL
jgi:predicted aconitase with swiveling domain